MVQKERFPFLREALKHLGVKQFPEREIANNLKELPDRFQLGNRVEFNHYGVPQQMYYEIFLKRYDTPNMYIPYMMGVSLQETMDRERLFSSEEIRSFNLTDAFNLLSGRAVVKTELQPDFNLPVRNSFQLDFNKKDESGNFVLNSHRADSIEADIQKTLSSYHIKENENSEDRLKLTRSILTGNPTPVTLFMGARIMKAFVELQGNPANVSVYDVPLIARLPLITKISLTPFPKAENANKIKKSKGRSM